MNSLTSRRIYMILEMFSGNAKWFRSGSFHEVTRRLARVAVVG